MIQSSLLPNIAGYVAGRWTTADGGRTFPVLNPATGEHLADVPSMSETQVAQAVEAADAAWAKPAPIAERRKWLEGIAAGLLADKESMARVITLEHGKPLCSHPAVRVIRFTGSTEIGKLLAEQAAPHLKRMALELGGNAPFIVFEDADVEHAVDALMVNKFHSAGQTCVCTNRVYVHASIADHFAAA